MRSAARRDSTTSAMATFYEDDVPAIATDFTVADHIARRPQRRDFCRKRGLVQRCWHNENVAMLPFTDDALAASVGATVAELNAKQINPLAADIVFDGTPAACKPSAPSDDERAGARASRLSFAPSWDRSLTSTTTLRCARPRSFVRLALFVRAERRVRRAAWMAALMRALLPTPSTVLAGRSSARSPSSLACSLRSASS